jgi:MFS family permease
MTAKAIDLHEELAEAKVGKFHWRLGAIMGLLTLFDGYDTFNQAYVIHYVAKPWGLQAGQAGLLISSGLVGFLLGAAIHGIIADRRPPRHPARWPVDHQHLHASDRDVRGLFPVILHPTASDRHRARRIAAFGDDLHQ